MTSHRKRKKQAHHRGLSVRELELCELLEEVLDSVRWLQILGYANQFLLDRHVEVDDAERNQVLEAAVRAVDKEKSQTAWRTRLAALKSSVEAEIRDGDAAPSAARPARDKEDEGHAGAS